MVGVAVGINNVAKRSLRQRANRRQELPRHRRELRVDHQDAVAADLHGDVAAGADEHVDVALRLLDVDLDVVEILLLGEDRETPERGKRDRGKRDVESCASHYLTPIISRSFLRYSGYIVSAPPRAASAGMPCAFAYSLRNGFVPGR